MKKFLTVFFNRKGGWKMYGSILSAEAIKTTNFNTFADGLADLINP